MSLEVPFVIGKLYWLPVLTPHQVTAPCPVCYGKLAVVVTLGNGEHVAVACDGCGLGFSGPRGYVEEYSYDHGAKPFTVSAVSSMHGQDWWLQSVEGETAQWSALCETEDAALQASKQRMQGVVEENTRRSSARRSCDLKKVAWTVRYHEQCIADFEKKIQWHRSKVTERKQTKQEVGV